MATYLYQFSSVMQKIPFLVLFEIKVPYIWCKFCIIVKQNDAETAPFKGAIWDQSENQDQHQSMKKAPYLMPN